MKKDQQQSPQRPSAAKGKATAADNRVAQRHQKQSQAAQLSTANAEESPFMDRGDSAEGAGESMEKGRDDGGAAESESLRRGAVDAQYGTRSSKPGQAGRASSGGSGASGNSEEGTETPNPGSSEESSGTERDTMTGPRPGGRS